MTADLVVSCSPYYKGWEALGPSLTGQEAEWAFYDDRPLYFWERLIRRPNVRMLRASLQAVIRAHRGGAKLLITQDPCATLWCGLICWVLRIRVKHYVNSLNFPQLPTGFRRHLLRIAFRQVARFSVHSQMEQRLYSAYFQLPIERLHLRLWSIGVPKSSPDSPLQKGRYVSAIGGNGRDYQTLLEASRLLGEIQFVIVVRPDNLEGLDIPPNVRVLVNAPFEEAMNILLYSDFTVVPLAGSAIPCGHVTLVCAMHLGRTVVATESEGISDYVISGFNGVLCQPYSVEGMAQAIDHLWNDPLEIARLATNNRRYGDANCSESRLRRDIACVLMDAGVRCATDGSRVQDLDNCEHEP